MMVLIFLALIISAFGNGKFFAKIRHKLGQAKAKIWILAFLLLVPGFAFANFSFLSLGIWLRSIALVVMVWWIMEYITQNPQIMPKILQIFAISAIVVLCSWLLVAEMGLVDYKANKWRSFFAGLMMILAASASQISWQKRGIIILLGVLLFLPPSVILGLASHGNLVSRMSFIAIIAAIFLGVAFALTRRYFPKYRIALVSILLAGYIGFCLSLIYISPKPEYTDKNFTKNSVELIKSYFGVAPLEVVNRFQIWGYAKLVAWENPFFGVGISQLRHQSGADIVIPGLNEAAGNNLKFAFVLTHPHFSWLEIATEGGLLAMIALFLALKFEIYGAIWRFFVNQQPQAIWSALILIYYSLASLSSFSIWSFHILSGIAFAFSLIRANEDIIGT